MPKKQEKKFEMRLWHDDEGNFNCDFKGKKTEAIECIATLMRENEVFAEVINIAAAVYNIHGK